MANRGDLSKSHGKKRKKKEKEKKNKLVGGVKMKWRLPWKKKKNK